MTHEAKDEAEAWGIYMQLINILRDVLRIPNAAGYTCRLMT